MPTLALKQVAVWLERFDPCSAAFSHALEWASRLGLSLCPFALTNGQLLTDASKEACAEVCARKGVPWSPAQPSYSQCLWVLGAALPEAAKERLLRDSFLQPDLPIMVCSAGYQPPRRILVVHENRDPNDRFLNSVGHICRAWQATPVVLTVGGTLREIQARQRFAEEAFARLGLAAYFDSIVGSDARRIAIRVAGWRRCSHVCMQKHKSTGWWRWLRGDAQWEAPGISSLTFLSLSGTELSLPSSAK
jgi:hypothetical protein